MNPTDVVTYPMIIIVVTIVRKLKDHNKIMKVLVLGSLAIPDMDSFGSFCNHDSSQCLTTVRMTVPVHNNGTDPL